MVFFVERGSIGAFLLNDSGRNEKAGAKLDVSAQT